MSQDNCERREDEISLLHMQKDGEKKKVLPLRRFAVKEGVPFIPSDAVLAHPPREQFPYPLDSDEATELLDVTESAVLRHRFGCWINDAKTGRHALLYYLAPDDKGHVSLRGVPAAHLRSFLDDVSYDWENFESSHVPPFNADDTPLFDPRFVSIARKLPTTGDAAAATAAKQFGAVTVEPKPEAKEGAAVTNGSTLGENLLEVHEERLNAATNKVITDADKWMHVHEDVEMKPKPKEEKPKPKAKAVAKPKAKAKAAAKPKAKATAATKKAASSDFTFLTGAVHEQEAQNFRAHPAFDMVRLWSGDVPANGIIPGSGMDPIVARTGNVIEVGEAELMCRHGDILKKHRAASRKKKRG